MYEECENKNGNTQYIMDAQTDSLHRETLSNVLRYRISENAAYPISLAARIPIGEFDIGAARGNRTPYAILFRDALYQ